MGDDINFGDYVVSADRYGDLFLTHPTPRWDCDVPGDGWTIDDLIRRARGHHAEAHRTVVDGEVDRG